MPRNGSGTYTLPAGNPVVTGTLIESSWANDTLGDLASAMTDSLSRDGEGGMTAALRVVDGTVSAPGLAFVNETGSGLYRISAGKVGLTALGSLVATFSSSGFKLDVNGAASIGGDLDVAGSVFRKQASGTGYFVYGTNGTTNNGLYYDQANSEVSIWTVSTKRLAVDSSGNGTITGNWIANYSDERLKTKLGNLESALDKICAIETFYYEANETAQALGYKAEREVGVSAQSVQAVFPELVAPAPVDAQYLTVRYERLVAPIIEAIKEMRAEVKALKGE